MDRQSDPEDVRRERRAERLRRAYEALGREQNGIFESLAEYTHELQAEVRALQITRDSLSVPGQSVVRIGHPLILGDRWVRWETATVGAAICGFIGVVLGMRGWWRDRAVSGKRYRPGVHED